MYTVLSTRRILFDPGPLPSVELATRYGFDAVDAPTHVFEDDSTRPDFVAAVREAGLRWGVVALPAPVGTMTADPDFDALVDRLERLAPRLADAGVTTLFHWLAPANDDLPFDEAMRLHIDRLDRIAPILRDHDLRLGLEYVGPRSFRAGKRYEFVKNLDDMTALIDGLADPGRFGLVLDTIHWHGAADTGDGVAALAGEDVLSVDLNDAPRGTDLDTLQDQEREMPGATGVIDVDTFVGALRSIGYAGPVQAEVFGPSLRDQPEEDRVRAARESLDAVLGR